MKISKNSSLGNVFRNTKNRRAKRSEIEEKSGFLENVKNAPDDKSIITDKTKAYYRFSRKYPAVTDSDGYRINVKPKTARKRLVAVFSAVLCIAAFCLGAIAVKTGILISSVSPSDITEPVAQTKGEFIVRFNSKKWTSDRDETISEWKDSGVTGILIDIKKPDGTIPYDLDGDSLKNILSSLKEAGFDTFGYVSCLKDTAYVNANSGNSVMIKNGDGAILYNKDGYAYINPFSTDGIEYVSGIISEASELDFTYFILDEITLPVKNGNSAPYYEGYTGGKNELNSALINIVNILVSAAGSERVIFTTDIYGFYTTDNVTGSRYEGRLFPQICKMRAVDLRLRLQNTGGKDPLGLVSQIKSLPTVFLLDGASLAMNETPEEMKLYALCDKAEDSEYIRASGINRIIVCE